MLRRASLLLALVAAVALLASRGSAHTPRSWPSRATPLNSTRGWFDAINAHNRARLLSYMAQSTYYQRGWAQPSATWSTFSKLKCWIRSSSPSRADVRCTFHESASPTEGNPDTFWDDYLVHTKHGWLVNSYGQG
jgi:hypothetical protein